MAKDKTKQIVLTVPRESGGDILYTGRFLGFIKDDEFNALAQEKEVAGKIESKESMDIVDVCRSNDDLDNMRLVMAVKKVDGVNTKAKKLFVSEKLTMIREVTDTEVTFMLEKTDDMIA